ncbi:hypothetical protein DFAR_4030004 [Desulfarculales bacterium]
MKPNNHAFFTLTSEPFGSDLAAKEIMQTAEVLGVAKRFEYALRLGVLALVTGDMGSGKSTALRRAASRRHPSECQIIWVTASQGSILETLQINLRRARRRHSQLFQGRPHQARQKIGLRGRPGPQEKTRLHHR